MRLLLACWCLNYVLTTLHWPLTCNATVFEKRKPKLKSSYENDDTSQFFDYRSPIPLNTQRNIITKILYDLKRGHKSDHTVELTDSSNEVKEDSTLLPDINSVITERSVEYKRLPDDSESDADTHARRRDYISNLPKPKKEMIDSILNNAVSQIFNRVIPGAQSIKSNETFTIAEVGAVTSKNNIPVANATLKNNIPVVDTTSFVESNTTAKNKITSYAKRKDVNKKDVVGSREEQDPDNNAINDTLLEQIDAVTLTTGDENVKMEKEVVNNFERPIDQPEEPAPAVNDVGRSWMPRDDDVTASHDTSHDMGSQFENDDEPPTANKGNRRSEYFYDPNAKDVGLTNEVDDEDNFMPSLRDVHTPSLREVQRHAEKHNLNLFQEPSTIRSHNAYRKHRVSSSEEPRNEYEKSLGEDYGTLFVKYSRGIKQLNFYNSDLHLAATVNSSESRLNAMKAVATVLKELGGLTFEDEDEGVVSKAQFDKLMVDADEEDEPMARSSEKSKRPNSPLNERQVRIAKFKDYTAPYIAHPVQGYDPHNPYTPHHLRPHILRPGQEEPRGEEGADGEEDAINYYQKNKPRDGERALDGEERGPFPTGQVGQMKRHSSQRRLYNDNDDVEINTSDDPDGDSEVEIELGSNHGGVFEGYSAVKQFHISPKKSRAAYELHSKKRKPREFHLVNSKKHGQASTSSTSSSTSSSSSSSSDSEWQKIRIKKTRKDPERLEMDRKVPNSLDLEPEYSYEPSQGAGLTILHKKKLPKLRRKVLPPVEEVIAETQDAAMTISQKKKAGGYRKLGNLTAVVNPLDFHEDEDIVNDGNKFFKQGSGGPPAASSQAPAKSPQQPVSVIATPALPARLTAESSAPFKLAEKTPLAPKTETTVSTPTMSEIKLAEKTPLAPKTETAASTPTMSEIRLAEKTPLAPKTETAVSAPTLSEIKASVGDASATPASAAPETKAATLDSTIFSSYQQLPSSASNKESLSKTDTGVLAPTTSEIKNVLSDASPALIPERSPLAPSGSTAAVESKPDNIYQHIRRQKKHRQLQKQLSSSSSAEKTPPVAKSDPEVLAPTATEIKDIINVQKQLSSSSSSEKLSSTSKSDSGSVAMTAKENKASIGDTFITSASDVIPPSSDSTSNNEKSSFDATSSPIETFDSVTDVVKVPQANMQVVKNYQEQLPSSSKTGSGVLAPTATEIKNVLTNPSPPPVTERSPLEPSGSSAAVESIVVDSSKHIRQQKKHRQLQKQLSSSSSAEKTPLVSKVDPEVVTPMEAEIKDIINVQKPLSSSSSAEKTTSVSKVDPRVVAPTATEIKDIINVQKELSSSSSAEKTTSVSKVDPGMVAPTATEIKDIINVQKPLSSSSSAEKTTSVSKVDPGVVAPTATEIKDIINVDSLPEVSERKPINPITPSVTSEPAVINSYQQLSSSSSKESVSSAGAPVLETKTDASVLAPTATEIKNILMNPNPSPVSERSPLRTSGSTAAVESVAVDNYQHIRQQKKHHQLRKQLSSSSSAERAPSKTDSGLIPTTARENKASVGDIFGTPASESKTGTGLLAPTATEIKDVLSDVSPKPVSERNPLEPSGSSAAVESIVTASSPDIRQQKKHHQLQKQLSPFSSTERDPGKANFGLIAAAAKEDKASFGDIFDPPASEISALTPPTSSDSTSNSEKSFAITTPFESFDSLTELGRTLLADTSASSSSTDFQDNLEKTSHLGKGHRDKKTNTATTVDLSDNEKRLSMYMKEKQKKLDTIKNTIDKLLLNMDIEKRFSKVYGNLSANNVKFKSAFFKNMSTAVETQSSINGDIGDEHLDFKEEDPKSQRNNLKYFIGMLGNGIKEASRKGRMFAIGKGNKPTAILKDVFHAIPSALYYQKPKLLRAVDEINELNHNILEIRHKMNMVKSFAPRSSLELANVKGVVFSDAGRGGKGGKGGNTTKAVTYVVHGNKTNSEVSEIRNGPGKGNHLFLFSDARKPKVDDNIRNENKEIVIPQMVEGEQKKETDIKDIHNNIEDEVMSGLKIDTVKALVKFENKQKTGKNTEDEDSVQQDKVSKDGDGNEKENKIQNDKKGKNTIGQENDDEEELAETKKAGPQKTNTSSATTAIVKSNTTKTLVNKTAIKEQQKIIRLHKLDEASPKASRKNNKSRHRIVDHREYMKTLDSGSMEKIQEFAAAEYFAQPTDGSIGSTEAAPEHNTKEGSLGKNLLAFSTGNANDDGLKILQTGSSGNGLILLNSNNETSSGIEEQLTSNTNNTDKGGGGEVKHLFVHMDVDDGEEVTSDSNKIFSPSSTATSATAAAPAKSTANAASTASASSASSAANAANTANAANAATATTAEAAQPSETEETAMASKTEDDENNAEEEEEEKESAGSRSSLKRRRRKRRRHRHHHHHRHSRPHRLSRFSNPKEMNRINDAIANLERYTGVDRGIKDDLNELRWNFLNVKDPEYNQRDFYANAEGEKPVGRIINFFPGEGEMMVTPSTSKTPDRLKTTGPETAAANTPDVSEEAKMAKTFSKDDEMSREKMDDERLRHYLSDGTKPASQTFPQAAEGAPALLHSSANELGLYERKPAEPQSKYNFGSSLNPGNMESAILSETERKKVHQDVDTDLRNIYDVMNSLRRETMKKKEGSRRKTNGNLIEKVIMNYRDDEAGLQARQEAQNILAHNKIIPDGTYLGRVGTLVKQNYVTDKPGEKDESSNYGKEKEDERDGSEISSSSSSSTAREIEPKKKVDEEQHQKAGKRHDKGELGVEDIEMGGSIKGDISNSIHKIINIIKQRNNDPDTLMNIGRDDVSSETRDVSETRGSLARDINDIRDINEARDISDTSLVQNVPEYNGETGAYNPNTEEKSEVFDSSLIVSQPDENVQNEHSPGYPAVEETGTSRDVIQTSSTSDRRKKKGKKRRKKKKAL